MISWPAMFSAADLGLTLALLLLWQNTSESWWIGIVVMLTRLAILALLIRGRLLPGFLRLFSGRLRIKSISFRSIRGLYLRTGNIQIHVDRIRFRYKPFGIRLETVRVEVGHSSASGTSVEKKPRAFSLSVLELALYPVIRRLAHFLLAVLYLIDPLVRPAVRYSVASLLRLVKKSLPAVAKSFDISASYVNVVLKGSLNPTMSLQQVDLHMALEFVGTVVQPSVASPPTMNGPRITSSVESWRKQMSGSIARALDRAWGDSEISVSVTMKCSQLSGTSDYVDSRGNTEFLSHPGTLTTSVSAKLRPRQRLLEDHSVSLNLDVQDTSFAVDMLLKILESLKLDAINRSLLEASLESHYARSRAGGSRSSFHIATNSRIFRAFSAQHRNFHKRWASTVLTSSSKQRKPVSVWMHAFSGIHVQLRSCRANFSMPATATDILPESISMSLSGLDVSALAIIPDQNELPEKWRGSTARSYTLKRGHCFVTAGLQSIAIDRDDRSEILRLIDVLPIELRVIVCQSLFNPPADSILEDSDPNESTIGMELDLSGFHVTERLENIQALLQGSRSLSPPPTSATPQKSEPRFSIPRLDCQVTCGSITASLLCPRGTSSRPLGVLLYSQGFLISGSSHFSYEPYRPNHHQLAHHHLPAELQVNVQTVLHPVFVRVQSQMSQDLELAPSRWGPEDKTFMGHSPLITLDSIELNLISKISATFDDIENRTTINMKTALHEVHCSTDALCVEIWDSDVVAAIKQIIALSENPAPVPSSPHKKISASLPCGVNGHLGVGRLVVLITSPDINPVEEAEFTRGAALRTSASIQFSCVQPVHLQHVRNMANTAQTRHKLSLPEDRLVQAATHARSSLVTKTRAGFLRFSLQQLKVRSAVATQYGQDDPLLAERDGEGFLDMDFLRFKKLNVELKVSQREEEDSKMEHTHAPALFDISVDIPHTYINVQLLHIYSTLLAAQLASHLFPPRAGAQPITSESLARPVFCIRFTAKKVYLASNLPHHNLWLKLHSLRGTLGSGTNHLTLGSLAGWALITPLHKWELDKDAGWKEVLRLQNWDLVLSSGNPPRLSGDSAQIRIPTGFILAHTVLDVTVMAKACRHLVRMVQEGRYRHMGSPEPEFAKKVPPMDIKIRRISLEAADDSLESQLGLIWRAGYQANRERRDRDDAFQAKVTAIVASGLPNEITDAQPQNDYHFDDKHSITIKEARERLNRLHTVDWTIRHGHLRKAQADEELRIRNTINGEFTPKEHGPSIGQVQKTDLTPPLIRLLLSGLVLKLRPPSFPLDNTSDFLFTHGKGVPRDTQFSLLVPMNIDLTATSLLIRIRDYPLPLFDLPNKESGAGFRFTTDLVIAEEMGTLSSIDWVGCNILEGNSGSTGARNWTLSVPKTIMPVKNYANPRIEVMTKEVVSFAWGGSYATAMQDVMRVVDSLTSPPRDTSPSLAFWDKIRLVFHWSIQANFKSNVRLYMKGSRDPFRLDGDGAGFVFSFQGRPNIRVGLENAEKEVIQLSSDSMVIAIPKLATLLKTGATPYDVDASRDFLKVCAKLKAGVRLGIGFFLERSCDLSCPDHCSGPPFYRKCRFFDFVPHHTLKLELKGDKPVLGSPQDTFRHFRANFVHLSASLASGTQPDRYKNSFSSIHLSPKVFAHFWSWWGLFSSELSLPIRQGSYYPPRPVSPKLGRHMGTIKYRFNLPCIYLFHAYIAESRSTWSDGVTPFVGAKAKIQDFKADLHQREQEIVVSSTVSGRSKTIRRKPFYAAEVILDGLDLRAVLASAPEPLKASVPLDGEGADEAYRDHLDSDSAPLTSWVDGDDFVELDWTSPTTPSVIFLPTAACPRFVYSRHNPARADSRSERTKFGHEDSHACLLGTQSSVAETQAYLARERIAQLKRERDPSQLDHKVALLEQYILRLQTEGYSRSEYSSSSVEQNGATGEDSSQFDNVYQIHQIQIFLDQAVRDIMMQYYQCSRARRGYEYHLATRAIKFIRDQVEAHELTEILDDDGTINSPRKATAMLRRIWSPDSKVPSMVVNDAFEEESINPLDGWLESDVFLQKSHFCILLKPQVVLRSEESICVLAAVDAQMRSFSILDRANIDDPISGRIMSRVYTSVIGLQAFSPTGVSLGERGVPLEVLIDLKCESEDFDRMVPQTDAKILYDKFNRLRLRNNIISVRPSARVSSDLVNDHLQSHTDLIRIHVPRLTVVANDQNFQTISQVVSKLLLFSDAAHKTRLENLRTMLFMYDFTDLDSAANVIADVQARLRAAIEMESGVQLRLQESGQTVELDLLKLRAHIFLLAEELNMLFDAVQLAQDQSDTDQRSALLLHTTASDVSWRMLDTHRHTLAKLAVKNIAYHWLNKQDGSMWNQLATADLQAFDGSPDAIWPEILSKYMEPSNHPLLKKGQFMAAQWTVLAPVGGISIYQEFDLSFHPMRLQVDGKLGTRIMEYVWPARRQRVFVDEPEEMTNSDEPESKRRASFGVNRALHTSGENTLMAPPLRRLGASRSFTDLRFSAKDTLEVPRLKRTPSINSLRLRSDTAQSTVDPLSRRAGDAAEMQTRSSQKSFVHVKISSLHLLLSVMKEGSFECRDARIRTRDLEYRNQTWSFEELVNQFIPSDMTWRGWVKMAFQQPLIPVLPVAKELFAKTKWIAVAKATKSSNLPAIEPPRERAPSRRNTAKLRKHHEGDDSEPRKRGLFSRASSRPRKSVDTPSAADRTSNSSSRRSME